MWEYVQINIKVLCTSCIENDWFLFYFRLESRLEWTYVWMIDWQFRENTTKTNGAWSNQTNHSLLGVNKKLEIRKCHHIQHSPCIEMTNFIFFKEHQLFGGVSLTLQDLTHNPPFYLWQSRVHPSDTSFYFSNVCHKPSMQHHLITNNVVSRDVSIQN